MSDVPVKAKAYAAKDFALWLSCQSKMTQNLSRDVVRPSTYTKKSRPLRPRFVRCWCDGSEGLNIQNTRTSIQLMSFPFNSPPSMLKLRGFQKGLSGYDGLSINERSIQPQLLLGTLTFLVYEDEEVSKECSKGAVKFCTFLCSWHRIRGFRPPKRMQTSWKWNKCSDRRCSSGNPLDAFHDSTHPRYFVENDWT